MDRNKQTKTKKSLLIIKTSFVIPIGLSDHDMVGCIRKKHFIKYKPKRIKCRNNRNYNPETISAEIKNIDWYPLFHLTNVNRAVEFLNTILSDIINRNIPYIERNIKGRPCPWIDEALRQQMDSRDKLLRKARRTNSEIDQNMFKRARNRSNNMLRKARADYYKNLLHEHHNQPKHFWNVLKKIFPTKCKSTSTNNETKQREKVNKFSAYFSSVVNNIKQKSFKIMDFVWRQPKLLPSNTQLKFKFEHVSNIFVRKQLKNLKRNKATGLMNFQQQY